MTYAQAVAYVDSFTNYERVHQPEAMRGINLERMRRLCRQLADPHRRFRAILVTGTNGKGSICAMLYSMLRESALRVGLYTSPHIEQLRERIRVWTIGPSAREREHGEDWISEAEFAAIVDWLRPRLETLRDGPPEDVPTYFEVLTAIAFVYFNQRQIDVAVLEVGMGGRLDATNVVEQAVSVISPIDMEHTEVLGRDLASIAKEKAGILKPGQIAITARQQEAVTEVLQTACANQGVPLFTCGEDFKVAIQQHSLEGMQVTITSLRGRYESLELPVIGRHQAENAALAVCALEALSNVGMPYSLIERGLGKVEWPGRMEVVHESPLVLLDGAHNIHAAGALVETLKELCQNRRIHFLVGMSSDKSPEAFGKLLSNLSVSVTCTKSRHPRAMDPVELAHRLSLFCPDVHMMPDPVDAYTYLLNMVEPTDVIVVTGSLFLVGQLRGALRRSHVRTKRATANA